MSLEDKLRELLEGKSSTVAEITVEYRMRELPRYVKSYGHQDLIARVINILEIEYGHLKSSEFGPRALSDLRRTHFMPGCCRKTANKKTRLIVAVFKWAVSREMCPASQLTALRSLSPLTSADAPDRPKREVVTLDQATKTVAQLHEPVATMVRLLLETGMRPSEVFQMSPQDAQDRWYRPQDHKTSAHASRSVRLPEWLTGDHLPFLTSKGNRWNKDAFRRAIVRASDRAGVARWQPYTLRHLAAQIVRENAGLDAAKALLGHTSSVITEQHYAGISEREAELAQSVLADTLARAETRRK